MDSEDSKYDRMSLDELLDICRQDKQNNLAWKSFSIRLTGILQAVVRKGNWSHVFTEEDIEDTIIETIVDVSRIIERLRTGCNWRAYISRMLVNKLIDRVRKIKERQSIEERIEELTAELGIENRKDNDLSDREEALHEAIERLPEKMQTAIIMYYLENFTPDEIAGVLHTNADYVYTLLSRARKRLQKFLKIVPKTQI